jgi:glutathione S-transferase
MRVYDSFGPNPRALRMFLMEKQLEFPSESLDILAGENRAAPYTAKNPGGQVPALELDDGRVLGETVAIFEYLEEKNPKPPLIGSTAEERAETRMWTRRIELNITEYIYNGFRFAEGLEVFRTRLPVIPEGAAGLKAAAQKRLAWLDGLMEGRTFIAGDRFTIADIVLYCGIDFGGSVGQPLDPACGRVTRWMARVAERPSAKASLHPHAAAIGMKG